MWLGPAPKVPFNANRWGVKTAGFPTFRYFWDYAGGAMTDWGVHLIDPLHQCFNEIMPTAVVALGDKFYVRDNVQTPGHHARHVLLPGSLAPPCSRPFRAPMAATMAECRSDSVEQTTRAVKVEALNSCSAYRISDTSRARTSAGARLARRAACTGSWPRATGRAAAATGGSPRLRRYWSATATGIWASSRSALRRLASWMQSAVSGSKWARTLTARAHGVHRRRSAAAARGAGRAAASGSRRAAARRFWKSASCRPVGQVAVQEQVSHLVEGRLARPVR